MTFVHINPQGNRQAGEWLRTAAESGSAEAQYHLATLYQAGRSGTNRLVTPVNQIVTPFGRQVDFAGLRPQAIALSPDGRLLEVDSVSGKVLRDFEVAPEPVFPAFLPARSQINLPGCEFYPAYSLRACCTSAITSG
jgi:hypothetical protein